MLGDSILSSRNYSSDKKSSSRIEQNSITDTKTKGLVTKQK